MIRSSTDGFADPSLTPARYIGYFASRWILQTDLDTIRLMQAELYLDTARLGRMCDEARRAEQQFATLVSLLGSSLYLEDFLFSGFETLPQSLRDVVPDLSVWNGIAELHLALRSQTFRENHANGYAFVCSESRTLISIATEALLGKATDILCTDLTWPPYLACIRGAAKKKGKQLHVVPLKDDLLAGHLTTEEVIERLAGVYVANDCEAAFLEPVSYLGIGLPIRRFVKRVKRDRRRPFLVLDAAQTSGHQPLNADQLGAELVIGGTQKWLRAYHPLRFGTTSERSASYVRRTIRRLFMQKQIHDPSLKLSNGWGDESYGETVHVLPMITAAAALRRCNVATNRLWRQRLENHERIRRHFVGTGQNVSLPVSQRTGIALLSVGKGVLDRRARETLLRSGVVASGFQDRLKRGILRVSVPDEPFTDAQLRRLVRAITKLNFCQRGVQCRRVYGPKEQPVSATRFTAELNWRRTTWPEFG